MYPYPQSLDELRHLDDRQLLKACLDDPKINYKCNDEFWHKRFVEKFGDPGKQQNWKNFYLNTLISIDIQPFLIEMKKNLTGSYRTKYLFLGEQDVPANRYLKNNMLWGQTMDNIYQCYNQTMSYITHNISPERKYKRTLRAIKWVSELYNSLYLEPLYLYNTLKSMSKNCMRSFQDVWFNGRIDDVWLKNLAD